MYFWRIEKLKREMALQPLSERETLPYLVVYAGLTAAVLYVPQELNNAWDYVGAGLNVLIAILGVIHVYRKNGGANGHHFLQRYFAIGWVVALRWSVMIILLSIMFYGLLLWLGDELEETFWYEVLFQAVLGAALYWRIGRHVSDLAQRTADSGPPVL
jgi:hypothetical protein